MPFKCAVYGCKGNYKKGKRVSIFRFPKDPHLKQIWITRMMRSNYEPTKYARVCELHFDETDIVREASFFDEKNNRLLTSRLQVPRLREGAIPLYPLVPDYDNTNGRPSNDPADPDYVPSVFSTTIKKTRANGKQLATPEDDEKEAHVWTSLLNLQPIGPETDTSGLLNLQPIDSEADTSDRSVSPEPQQAKNKLEVPKIKKISTKAADSSMSKPKAKTKPKSISHREQLESSATSNNSVESKMEDPLTLCVIKMEIEDDGYANNEEDNLLASLASSSSQKSLDNNSDISFSSSSSVKIEPDSEEAPTVFKIVPVINECTASPSNCSHDSVEAFFKNVAQTVVQLPPHLIEETKTKVSALVYEMVIQALGEGCANIKPHKL